MDKRKKFMPLLIAAAIAAVLSGCLTQEPDPTPASTTAQSLPTVPTTAAPTEPEITAHYLASQILLASKDKGVHTMQATVNMDVAFGVSASGFNMDMEMNLDLNMDMCMSNEPFSQYMDMYTTVTFADTITTEHEQTYALLENGTVSTYTYTESLDTWYRTGSDVTPESMPQQEPSYDWLVKKSSDELSVEDGLRRLNGTQVYVLQCTIDGEELQQVMQSVGFSEDSLFSGDSVTSGEQDLSAICAPTILYIDSESFLPVRIEIDLQGMDSLLDEILGEDFASLPEGMDWNISIPKFTMIFSDIGYEPVEVPQLPQEAVDYVTQSGADPDLGDGTYVIQESGDAVRITCPQDWYTEVWDYSTIQLHNEYYTQYATYTMLTDMTREDLREYIRINFIPELISAGYYTSREDGPTIGDYETIWVKDDEVNVYCAYKQVGSSWLLVTVYDFTLTDYTEILTPLLDAVSDYRLGSQGTGL